MKYFILSQQPIFSEGFRLSGWQEKINPKWNCLEDFHKMPRRCILDASMGEFVPFPDVVTAPFLLLSSLMVEMAKMYGETVYLRDVVAVDGKEQQSKQYHLVLLETMGQGHVLFGERHLFHMDIGGRRELIASQDYAESVLRRGAVGIMLKEIDTREERFYGK